MNKYFTILKNSFFLQFYAFGLVRIQRLSNTEFTTIYEKLRIIIIISATKLT